MNQAEAIASYKDQVKRKMQALNDWLAKADQQSYSASIRESVKARYTNDINNLRQRLQQLEDGVPVDVVLNPPSDWKPGSGNPPPGLSDAFFSLPEDKYKSTVWHETGHHIHQQLAVNNVEHYVRPPLERDLEKLRRRPGRIYPTRYSMTNHKEWFAESYALYRMGRSDLLDKDLLQLIIKIESGGYAGD